MDSQAIVQERKRGRKRIDPEAGVVETTIKMPPRYRDRLRSAATETGFSQSAIVRALLDDHLADLVAQIKGTLAEEKPHGRSTAA